MVACHRKLKLMTGTSNTELAQEISDVLGTPLVKSAVTRFSDGEIRVQIFETVRGADVFVIQSLGSPVHDNIMELLIMADALMRASARSVTAVIPYYGYARQDRKSSSREPITAKLLANLIVTAGVNRVLTLDLHAPQIQGFFDIPVDHMLAAPLLADYLKDIGLSDCVVVSPDVGGVSRARALAERIGATLAIIDKRRPKPNVSEVMHIIGDVQGKVCVLVDDIIDTAGTLCQAADALMEHGAKEVYAACSHGVLSGPAIERINGSCLQQVVITNSVPRDLNSPCDKVKVISVGQMMAEAIRRIYEELSVSILFN
ncbi:MAG TPA: ribose-phosphate pyrophosphokinase [Bacillota bacterium]|nr:ribose-phosphate pyrophosphokinase [Bacillota bacterium]HPI01552.1 ribose-phosphate pyrophosphokinase [Bacillota bacterium]